MGKYNTNDKEGDKWLTDKIKKDIKSDPVKTEISKLVKEHNTTKSPSERETLLKKIEKLDAERRNNELKK